MGKTKIDSAYISALCGELAQAVSAGVTINDGLYMMIEDGREDPVINRLLEETNNGGGFADALKAVGGFPTYVEEMVEIGEQTGRLDSVLKGLSVYYARQNEISENIKNAVAFPVILLVILIVIVVVLLTQVLPIFNDVFRQLGVSMSAAATALMNIGSVIRTYAVFIAAAAAILAAIVFILYKLPATHGGIVAFFQGRKLRRKMSSSVFASAMSMTISSGMDIDDSLSMSKKLCGADTAARITACQNDMKEGMSFDKAIQRSGILDPAGARRLAVSFRTGKTDEAMRKIADEYAAQVNNAIDEKISRVEPALVIIMSLIVGFVLFSVMIPMLSVITAI